MAVFGPGSQAQAREAAAALEDAGLHEALSQPEDIERLPALKAEIGELLDRLRASPYDRGDLLSLAHLYHANGYAERARPLYDWLAAGSGDAEERARLLYLAADVVKEKGDSAAGAAYLEASIHEYGGYPLAQARLGEARLKTNELAEAERLFKKALSGASDLSLARLGLARVYEQRGASEDAIRELERLLQSEPDNYNAQALLSRLLSQKGDRKGAFEVAQSFERSIAPPIDDPWLEPVRAAVYDPQLLDFLFLDYFHLDDYDKALSYLERMERIDPGNARHYRYRGIVLTKKEHYREAATCFRIGLERGGDDKELYPLLVQSLKLAGLTGEAEAEARKGLAQADPKAELFLELARLLVDREARGEAMEVLSRALEVDPYDVEVHLLRARVGMWTGAVEEARESLAMVKQLAPSNYVVLVRAALVWMEAGRFAEALPFLEQARRVSPSYKDANELLADANVQLGKAAYADGRIDLALEHLDRALSIDPQQLEALSAKAQFLIELRRFEQAEAAMRDLIGTRAGTVTTFLIYGDLLYKNGKRSEARDVWTQALERASGSGNQSELTRKILQRLNGSE